MPKSEEAKSAHEERKTFLRDTLVSILENQQGPEMLGNLAENREAELAEKLKHRPTTQSVTISRELQTIALLRLGHLLGGEK